MAGFALKFDRKSTELFKKLGDKKLLRLNKAFKDVGDDFRKTAGAIFENTAGNLRFWKDLKPNTKKRKLEKFGFVYPTLFNTGVLRDTFSEISDSENVEVIKDKIATFGSASDIATYHQEGRGNLPKREIINKGWVDKNKKRWIQRIEKELVKLWTQAGIHVRRTL